MRARSGRGPGRVTATSPRPPRRASTSQSPKRARPGTGSCTGSGRGSVRRARVKRSVPYSTTARSPPPRSSDLRASLAEREDLVELAGAEHAVRRRRARAARAGARPAGCSRRAASDTAGPAAQLPPALPSTTASSTSASSRSCRAVSAIVRSAAGDSSRSASITSCRTRARAKRRSAFDGSSRHSSPRARRYSRTSSRVTPSSGRTSRPRRGSHPVQRPRPRRDGQAVENGLGLVGGGVRRGVVARGEVARRARSGRRAHAPGGSLPRCSARTCSTVSGTPSSLAELSARAPRRLRLRRAARSSRAARRLARRAARATSSSATESPPPDTITSSGSP